MPRGFSDQKQANFESEKEFAKALKPLETASALGRAMLTIGPGGRVVIPADMREAMGLKQGDGILAVLDANRELRLATVNDTIRQLQELTRTRVPEGVSLVDELMAERRAEAAKEADDN